MLRTDLVNLFLYSYETHPSDYEKYLDVDKQINKKENAAQKYETDDKTNVFLCKSMQMRMKHK
jgi:hypothetical protein